LEHSLPEAMRQSFAAATEDAKVEFRFEVEGDPRELPATTANHLLRIACEAVRNAVQHANAERIATRLAYNGEGVDLEIDDDGAGFPADQKPPAGHFGLTGMRERANKIHADFSIQSSADLGSNVRVHLPWSSPVAHSESPS
jgi:signal transduction histidine kinase